MAFRKVFIALAVLVALTGLANAQVTNQFTCTASAAVPPLLRVEGITELVGDILIQCTGGVTVTSGAIPTANFQVFIGNAAVTNRINSSSVSDAVLLVDEPGSTLNPWAPTVYAGGTGTAPLNIAGTSGCTPCSTSGTVPNAFYGTVTGANSVTFIGVPVNPPGTLQGTARVFRISGVRINANAIGAAGGVAAPNGVLAYVSISGSTSVPLFSPQQTVGYVQKGLNFSLVKTNESDSLGGVSGTQCSSSKSTTLQGYLRFAEGFATAFKVQSSVGATGQPLAGLSNQVIPGQIYNTETGLVLGNLTATSGAVPFTGAGQADFGTRLRAVFKNIPTGVSVYVNTNATVVPASTPASTAVLMAVSDTTAGLPNSTLGVGKPVALTTSSSYQVPLDATGSGVAIWEVTGANAFASENFDFGFYLAWSGNPGTNTPAVGVQGTVAGSFAPVSTNTSASTSAPVPRFIDTGSPLNLIIIKLCQTSLLFPFVTTNGFDTGIAISNTSKDPFGTSPQAGTCALNFYGDNAPSAVTTSSIAGGSYYVVGALSIAPNFTGYMIAVCNFQMAHGFAFISDVGAQKLAMGYLALVIPGGRLTGILTDTGNEAFAQ